MKLVQTLLIVAFLLLAILFVAMKVLPPNVAVKNLQAIITSKKFEALEKPIPFGVSSVKLEKIKSTIRQKNFNNKIAFVVDMSKPSGKNRFYVYELSTDSVANTGLVTNGRSDAVGNIIYSNEVGSNCTSEGNYKIGGKYYGKFGLAYKLYGLNTSNSNAFERFVVLHSHSCVPNAEVDGQICESQGCPSVSPEFLSDLEKLIDASKQPIMLTILK